MRRKMPKVGYFNVEARRREKQAARERDEFLMSSGQVSPQQIGQHNGLFSSLDPAHARIVRRRAPVRVAHA